MTDKKIRILVHGKPRTGEFRAVTNKTTLIVDDLSGAQAKLMKEAIEKNKETN